MAAKTHKKDETQTLKQKARALATTQLIGNHADEYRRLMVWAHEEYGVEYRPRLSPEEKARKQVEALLAEFPSIKDDLAG